MPHRDRVVPSGPGRSAPHPRKRGRLIAALAVLLAASAAVGAGALTWSIATAAPSTNANANANVSASAPQLEDEVLSVNSVGVPFRALDLYLARDRSAVVAYYQNAGMDVQTADFWTNPVGGQTPADRLVQTATADTVRLQVQLGVIHSAGVATPSDYGQIVEAWQNENARRSAAIAAGQPVYGPQQFTESDFVDYLLGDLGQQAQLALAQNGTFDASEAGAREYYNAHRTDSGGDFDTAKQQITMRYLDSQYQQRVASAVSAATVATSPALASLPALACVAQGSC